MPTGEPGRHVGDGRGDGSSPASGVPCRGGAGGDPYARGGERSVTRIQRWNGGTCKLELAAVSRASASIGAEADAPRTGGPA